MVSLDHLTPAECIRLEYYFRYTRFLTDRYYERPGTYKLIAVTDKLIDGHEFRSGLTELNPWTCRAASSQLKNWYISDLLTVTIQKSKTNQSVFLS